MREDVHKKIRDIEKTVQDLEKAIAVEQLQARIDQIQAKMSSPGFWEDQEGSKTYIQELKRIKGIVELYSRIKQEFQDLKELSEIISDDESQAGDIAKEVDSVTQKVDSLRLKTILSDEFDSNDAILTINSGAGGVDACDWASMLLRMYTRWAEEKGYKVSLIDALYEQEAGIRNATLVVKGPYAYGYLKSETGVHRLVRISPFDANKRRHTSFASVEVIPQIDKSVDIQIKDDDIKVETFRASGAGGQHVNVTDSAVRITHIPTGIVVQCQNERSQYQNKQTALKVLTARLFELQQEEMKDKLDNLNPDKRKIEWGSQIRSYVLHPYTMVKDHRTNKEISNVNGVLDGNIGPFIEASLLNIQK